MKKFSSLLFLILFVMGCSDGAIVTPEDSSLSEAEVTEPVEIEAKDIIEFTDYVTSSNSVLTDDSGVGFAYEDSMVLDNDFSTAWCSEGGGTDAEVSFEFPELVEADTVGIVPGFGRDESIYFQNNRVKELTVVFDAGKDQTEETYEFEDDYNMHFLDLKGYKFKKITFKVDEIFEGSKYDDTCIAEIDFWSDYVVNEDKEAAMNYYKKYKEDFALRPNDIIGAVWISEQAPDSCNEFVKSDYGIVFEDLFALPVVSHVYITAVVNEYGSEGDTVDFKWYKAILDPDSAPYDLDNVLEWEYYSSESNVPVVETCNGELYANVLFDLGDTVHAPTGRYKIVVYRNEKIVGSRVFSLSDQLGEIQ